MIFSKLWLKLGPSVSMGSRVFIIPSRVRDHLLHVRYTLQPWNRIECLAIYGASPKILLVSRSVRRTPFRPLSVFTVLLISSLKQSMLGAFEMLFLVSASPVPWRL